MKLIIKDKSVCENCKRKTCAMGDVVERVLFVRFKTERYTCPVRCLQAEPSDRQIELARIDLPPAKSEDAVQCIHCGLCALKCSMKNIEVISEGVDRFPPFIEGSCAQNVGVANIIATSFLNILFDFAANTNLNKALLFDGVVCDKQGRYAFVEVDEGDDSLESCRRLLGDIVSHNFKNPKIKVNAGLMVLKTIPRAGTRDVITLVDKMKQFPRTTKIDIFVTTLDILRRLCLKFKESQYTLGDIFYNVSRESYEQYVARMESINFSI